MMPPNRRAVFAAGAAAVLVSFAPGADEEPTFSVDVSVVNILASVRDGDGGIINNLVKEDFILSENGVEQEIRYFAKQTDLPLTIGLLVDTSLSQRNVIDIERSASYAFLDQVLRPGRDEAFLISFDVEAELLQDLTSSRQALERGLSKLELPESPLNKPRQRRFIGSGFQQWPGGGWPGSGGSGWPGGGGTSRGGGRGGNYPGGPPGPQPKGGSQGIGTVMYDSVFLAADEVLREQSGRKTIILISDGVDMGSIVSRYDAIEAAQRADTIIYGIRYYDDQAYSRGGGARGGGGGAHGGGGGAHGGGGGAHGGGGGARSGGRGSRGGRGGGANRESAGLTALEQMSMETGGRMFEVQDGLPLEAIFETIQEELRNQYSIGYTPATETAGAFRQIRLVAKDKDLTVQARTGYYSGRAD